MTTTLHHSPNGIFVRIGPDLDRSAVPNVERSIGSMESGDVNVVVLNLHDTRRIDNDGLDLLYRLRDNRAAKSVRIVINEAAYGIRRLLVDRGLTSPLALGCAQHEGLLLAAEPGVTTAAGRAAFLRRN